jgi:hypothetical protein
MPETLERFREPKVAGILADLLCGLIVDIRRILMQPTQNHVKLALIAQAVDELAPPPPPPGEWPDAELLGG